MTTPQYGNSEPGRTPDEQSEGSAQPTPPGQVSGSGGFAPPSGAQPNGQPPQYGQPAPQYGQQAPQYGQQIPQFGQPAPQFNQPGGHPPHYGSPQFGGPPQSARGLKPGIIPLRPITLGEIFDGAFGAMRRSPKILFGLVALVVSACVITAALVGYLLLPTINSTTLGQEITSDEELSLVLGTTLGTLSTDLLIALGNTLAATIATGIVVLAIGQLVINKEYTPSQVWERVGPRVWDLLAVSLLPALALLIVGAAYAALVYFTSQASEVLGILVMLLGLFLLFIGTLFITVKLLFAPSALILEERKIFSAFKRSWQLTRGSFWRTLGIYLLTTIALSFVAGILSGTLQGILAAFNLMDYTNPLALGLNVIIQILVGTVTVAFTASVVTLLYIDVRMRREALDVDLAKSAVFDQ
ncbi:glycerophosphoryl diester phosphodiesterase membrane domain-containing protein [Timonella sp. A28]|uniref:proline-rich domain-containing protein n=1 Tax=Timonella sp. A28 TaxID=3442640 RepID=UPI003EB9EC7C